jgi:hypothetical protein
MSRTLFPSRIYPGILPFIAVSFLLSASSLGAQTNPGNVRKDIIDTAKTYLGVPYVYGAESPKAFDCSGFVRYVYNQAASIVLPRTSKSQWAAGVPTTLSKAKPGDVLVFDTVGGAPSHVAILMDEKSFINAISDGPKTGVVISQLGSYWSPLLMGARVYVVAGDEPVIPMKRADQPTTTPEPAKPKPEPAKPNPEPAKPAPEPAQTKPETAKPVPESVKVAPEPARPAPEPAKPAQEPAKPAPEPARSAPAVAKPLPQDELPVSFIGFAITNTMQRTTDKIPAQVGTAIQYAVTNSTGKDGVFEILFYKMDLDPAKHQTLRRDRVSIPAGGMRLVEPFTFTSPGQYRLILKTHDNLQRVERIWKVVEVQ